eukprot:Pgem_evm1s5198
MLINVNLLTDCICPSDMMQISDDLFSDCHSGTIGDLPYSFSPDKISNNLRISNNLAFNTQIQNLITGQDEAGTSLFISDDDDYDEPQNEEEN